MSGQVYYHAYTWAGKMWRVCAYRWVTLHHFIVVGKVRAFIDLLRFRLEEIVTVSSTCYPLFLYSHHTVERLGRPQ